MHKLVVRIMAGGLVYGMLVLALAGTGCGGSSRTQDGTGGIGQTESGTGGSVVQGGHTAIAGGTAAGGVTVGGSGGTIGPVGGNASGGKSGGGNVAGTGGSSTQNTAGASGGAIEATGGKTAVAIGPTETKPIGFAAVSALGVNTTKGGAGGKVVTANTAEELLAYMDSEDTLIITISGTIDLGGMTALRSNKTLIGLSGARLINGGLELYKRQNIIIRNITFADGTDDTMKVNQNTHHLWVDHCDFTNSADGLFDITRQSSYITLSWNHFYKHSKTMLIGHSDSETADTGFLKTTIHNNWFDGTEQRHPRVRFGEVHVFNNYFLNNALYGVASTMEADVVMEGNYFENVPYPSYTGYAESAPGDLVERNNIYKNSGTPQTRGTAFDPTVYYPYTVTNPELIPEQVRAGAGVGVIDPNAAAHE